MDANGNPIGPAGGIGGGTQPQQLTAQQKLELEGFMKEGMQTMENGVNASLARIMEELRALKTDAENRAAASAKGPPPPPQPPTPILIEKKKASLPTPEKYDHTKPSTYKAWELSIQAKLARDAAFIGGESDQCYYIYDRLTGAAAQRLYGWMTQYHENAGEFTVANMLKEMQSAFGDKHAAQKALQQLITAKQGKQSIGAHIQATNIRLMELGLYYKTDADSELAKKGYLSGGINAALWDKTVGMEESQSYEGFCTQLKTIADRIAQGKNRDLARPVHQSPSVQAETDDNAMDWEATPANSNAKKLSARKEKGGRRAPRENYCTEEEKKRRFDAGLCLRCGGKSHFVRDCTVDLEKLKKRKNKVASVAQTPAAATKPAKPKRTKMVEITDDEAESDSSNDQGKA